MSLKSKSSRTPSTRMSETPTPLRIESCHEYVIGLDEVGNGCLAGPLVLCAVISRNGAPSPGPWIIDSKRLTKSGGLVMGTKLLFQYPYFWNFGFGYATAREINILGHGQAWNKAAEMAVKMVYRPGSFLVIDGVRPIPNYQGAGACIPKAEDRCWQVAAASILAKVCRDTCMVGTFEPLFPGYGLGTHMGYPTTQHIKSLLSKGLSPAHRILASNTAMKNHRGRH